MGVRATPASRRSPRCAAFGVDVMFTLNGGHIWPLYEARRNQGVRIVDTRHEQSATFAAEACAKLTRRPGVAALTAGPGITNGVSAVTSAWFNGSPARRARRPGAAGAWGAGSLQELDHVPILDSITKSAATVTDPTKAGRTVHDAVALAARPAPRAGVPRLPARRVRAVGGRGPGGRPLRRRRAPIPTRSAALAALIAGAERPVFIVGSDVYWAGAMAAAGRGRRAPAGAGVHERPRPRHAAGRPRAGLPAHAGPAQAAGRRRRRARHPARLPARLRSLRRRHGGPRRRRRVAAAPPRRRADRRRRPRGHRCAQLADRTGQRADHEPWIAELRAAEEAARAAEAAAARRGRRRRSSRAGCTASCAGGSTATPS